MAEAQLSARVREYETIYILKPDVARDAQERIAGRLTEILGRENGKLTLVENWGRRQLAYPVAKCRRGLYVYLKYLGGGALVAEVERNLRMLDDVIKYQTVLLKTDVDAGGVSINDEDVKFEAVELPTEEEPEESLERRLGLVEGERPRSDDEGGYADDEFGGDAGDAPDLESE